MSALHHQRVIEHAPFVCAWLAEVLAAAGSGVLATLALAGELPGLLAWVTGALFIPALALVLSVWGSGRKLFEVIYMAW